MAQNGMIGNKEFVRLISAHESLSAADVLLTASLLEKYPYCQALHFIHASGLKNTHSEEFDGIIQRSAVYSPSRQLLYRFIEKPDQLKKLFFEESSPYKERIPSPIALNSGSRELAPAEEEISVQEIAAAESLLSDSLNESAEEFALLSENIETEVFEENTALTEEHKSDLNQEDNLVNDETSGFGDSGSETPSEDERVITAEPETISPEEDTVYDEIAEADSFGTAHVSNEEQEAVEENHLHDSSKAELEPAEPAAETGQTDESPSTAGAAIESQEEENLVFDEIAEAYSSSDTEASEDEEKTEISAAENDDQIVDEDDLVYDEIAEMHYRSEPSEPLDASLNAEDNSEAEEEDAVFDEINEAETFDGLAEDEYGEELSEEILDEEQEIVLQEAGAVNQHQELEDTAEPSLAAVSSFEEDEKIYDEISEIESNTNLILPAGDEEQTDTIAAAASADQIRSYETKASAAGEIENIEEDEHQDFTAGDSEDLKEESGQWVEEEAKLSNGFEDIKAEDLAAAAAFSKLASLANIADEIETVIPDFEFPYQQEEEEKSTSSLAGENNWPETEETFHAEHTEFTSAEEAEAKQSPPAEIAYPEEKLMVDSIAARDYFIFDRSSVDPLQASEDRAPKTAPSKLSVAAEEAEVTKYHDDSMPFTFLWWLSKTRKEHAAYQPYAVNSPAVHSAVPASTGLDQQIIESIFHHQPELNTFPEAAAEIAPAPQLEELQKKEEDLIERFIKEEPQIKSPMAAKIDTENKARKSSEDNLDLVSETLAKIYIDQMLYHKAIETYRKLSLKFPEKSTYFATQILDLEKKIN